MTRSSSTSSSSSTAHHGCVSRYSLVVFVSAFLLVATSDNNAGARTVEAWSLNPFHGRRGRGGGGRRRHRGSVATTTKSTAAVVDGRLFYQDGVTSSSSSSPAMEDTTFMLSLVDVSRAAAIPTTATAPQQQPTAHNIINRNKPKSIFLPRRSPSQQELQRRKQLLDTELVVGRFAMVTAIVMAVGEILAMSNQLLQ
mmetsp:Transcript_8550/g.21353  ORF Transcript_8550/g.21353 Transcript_8550/m.21353 type:complete len:197 (-) Transcript_8550:279-869(-)